MSPNIIEIETVNLPREMRQFRGEDRFVAYAPDGYVSEPTDYSSAVRLACGMRADACVGFLPGEPEPVTAAPAGKPDYSQPLPEILSRTKRGGRK